MKKIFFCACLLAFGATTCMAQSWVVKEKKGKVTMDKAYYLDLKAQATRSDSLQAEITRLQGEVAKEKNNANQRTQILTFNDSASYAIGRDLHDNWARQSLGINLDAVIQSLKDCQHGQNTWSDATLQSLLQRFQKNFEERE